MGSQRNRTVALDTERLQLRPITAADLDALHSISNDTLVRRFLWKDEPVSVEQMRALIGASEALLLESGIGLFGMRLRGRDTLVGLLRFSALGRYG